MKNFLMIMFLLLATTFVWSAKIPPRPANDKDIPWSSEVIHTNPVLSKGLDPANVTPGYQLMNMTSIDKEGRQVSMDKDGKFVSYYVVWTQGADGGYTWVKLLPSESVEAKKTGQKLVKMNNNEYVVFTWHAKRIQRCGNPTDITFYQWNLKEVVLQLLKGENGKDGQPGKDGQAGASAQSPPVPNISVNPPTVNVAAPNVSVQPASIHVAAPNVSIQPANIYVQPTPVTVASPIIYMVMPGSPEPVYGSRTIGGDTESWISERDLAAMTTQIFEIINSNFQTQNQTQNQDQNQNQTVTVK